MLYCGKLTTHGIGNNETVFVLSGRGGFVPLVNAGNEAVASMARVEAGRPVGVDGDLGEVSLGGGQTCKAIVAKQYYQ